MMKTFVSFLTVALMLVATTAFATDYNPETDWVDAPGSPTAWTYGYRVQQDTGSGWAGTGVFDDFVAMDTHIPDLWTTAPTGDVWSDSLVDPHWTLSVWKVVPWNAGKTVGMMAWDPWSPSARLNPEAGIYDITGQFDGIGYVSEFLFPGADLYIIKNDTDVLWSGAVFDYSTPAAFNLTNVSFAAGDYVEFIVANKYGLPDTRAALSADIVLVPEPMTLSLLGLGGLALLRRRRA